MFLRILLKLNGYKTYIVCFFTIAYNLSMAWNGTVDWNSAIGKSQEALMVATLRHGISTLATPKT